MSTSIYSPRKYSPRRIHKRISMRFPLEVAGKDENGHPFRTVALVRNVSSHGGCLAIVKDLAKGDMVQLINRKGFSFIAKVRWSLYHYITDHRYVGFDVVEGNHNWVLKDVSLSWFFQP